MRTRNLLKYVLATIVAIGTSVNVMAQETKAMQLYFNTYQTSGGTPTFSLSGDVPTNVGATATGFEWANTYTVFAQRNCQDRILAKKGEGNKYTYASISFTNMKYEIMDVQWNRMNDIFNNSPFELFRTFRVIGTVESYNGSKVEGSEGTWMVFNKDLSFKKDRFPPNRRGNININGLNSIIIGESNSTILFGSERVINDNCRFFMKAGTVGSNDWAFKVTYYEPTLAYTTAMPSSLVIGDQKNVAYQISHIGAFEFNASNYTYSSSNSNVIEVSNSGLMRAKAEGSADITMTIKSTDGMVEKSVTKTVEVYSLNSALRFFHVNRNANLVDNRADVLVSNMDHQKNSGDVDYTLTNISSNGFTLKSSSSRNFRVGFVPFGLNVASPKYTKVTPSWTFNVENSKNNDDNQGQSTINSGIEILYLPNGKDFDNIKNINVKTTDGSQPTNAHSVIKKYGTTKIENQSVTTSTLNTNNFNFVFDNSQNGSISEKPYHFAAIAYTRETNSQVEVHSNFTYSENASSYEYFAHINYVMGEGCPFAKPSDQTIHSTSMNEGSNLYSVNDVSGYTFKGWSLVEGASVADYENGATFIPYDDVDGGGKGPVTLYAVWEGNEYIVSLNHNGGQSSIKSVNVTYGKPWPVAPAPTKTGYNFEGYYGSSSGTPYYDSNMQTVNNWQFTSGGSIIAHWTPKTTEITFDPQGGNGGPGKLIATYDQSLPNAWAPNHSDYGYEFKGYFTEPGGRGKQYYSVVNNNVVGIGQWDRQDASIILYAYWTPKTYTLTLKHNDGTNVEDKVQVTYTQSMPDAPKPSRLGYEFEGYYRWDNTQFYDKDMNSVQPWDLRNDSYLEAHWTPIKYVLTLNAGPNTVIPTTNFGNGTHSYTVSEDRTTITMNVSLDENLGSFYNGVPKKPGFKFDGFYVDDILVASATGDKGRNLEFTNNGGYINNSVWKYTGNLTITARWIPKYTLSDNVLTFNDGEYLEVGKDWQSGKVNDLLGATEYEVQQGNISSNNPVMAFDIRNAIYLDGSSNNADDLMQSLQNKSYISPNALVYVGPDAYSEVKVNNVIRPSGQGDEAKFNNLVVTDRYPIKIIDDFTAQTAAYRRNQAQVGSTTDGMWTQSSGSRWGTLCLPFEIKNMAHGIQFYELRDIHDGAMCFYEFPADYVLPANTPVVYKRMSGAGSDISVLVNSQVNVGENKTYATNDIYYNNAPNAKPAIKDWEFRGTLQEVVCCGKDYQNPPANAWVIVNKAEEEGEAVPQDVYYFKQDTFTRLGTKTKATCLPYRAYFYRTSDGHNSQSKDSSFSILVMDEDGATDITSLLDSKEVKANGKIYDLSGRRVMQPVKGRLYIVDGKKKVY